MTNSLQIAWQENTKGEQKKKTIRWDTLSRQEWLSYLSKHEPLLCLNHKLIRQDTDFAP